MPRRDRHGKSVEFRTEDSLTAAKDLKLPTLQHHFDDRQGAAAWKRNVKTQIDVTFSEHDFSTGG